MGWNHCHGPQDRISPGSGGNPPIRAIGAARFLGLERQDDYNREEPYPGKEPRLGCNQPSCSF